MAGSIGFTNSPNFDDIPFSMQRIWLPIKDKLDRIFVVELPVFSSNGPQTDNISAAIDTVTLGTVVGGYNQITPNLRYVGSTTPPTDPNALLELAWKVSVEHPNPTLGLAYNFLIPCADASLLALGSDRMDPNWSGYADFVTRIQNRVRVPGTPEEDTDDTVVTDVRLVGLNR